MTLRFLLCLLLTGSMTLAAADKKENILKNADFKKVDKDKKPKNWTLKIRDIGASPAQKEHGGSVTFSIEKDSKNRRNKVVKMDCSLEKQYLKVYIGNAKTLKLPKRDSQVTYRLEVDAKWKQKKLKDKGKPTFYFVPTSGDYVKIEQDGKWNHYVVDYMIPADMKNMEVKIQGARILGTLEFKNLIIYKLD